MDSIWSKCGLLRSFFKLSEALREAYVEIPFYHVIIESPRTIECTPAMCSRQCSMIRDASSNIQRSRAALPQSSR
jgi:hypothetical protein